MAERVAITESLLDTLADAISTKSGESTPMTLAEMTDAVNGISAPTGTVNINSNGTHNVLQYAYADVSVPGGAATLQSKSKGYTPTESAQTETVSADVGYDGLSSVDVSVGAIPSNYVGSGVTRRGDADVTQEDEYVLGAAGYYQTGFEYEIPGGTAGTPTATKGAVSNHAVSVTPSVTNTTGYIAGSTKTGTAVSVSASELVSGSETKTANGTYDVTNLATLVVNVSGGGGLTLLKTTSLGTLSTSSTSASDTGKSMTVTGYNDYDVLIVDVSVNTTTNGRHTSTVSMVYLTGTSNVNTKNTYAVASNKWNSKLGSTGTGSTRQGTTAYGIYVNSATVSSSTMTLTFYYRYNSNSTGTINGAYTARVYGCKLYDLIGG